jgi:putative ATPase
MEESLQKKIAPQSIDEFIGQKHIVGEGKYLRRAIENGNIRSSLFYGPSGSGKTVLASIIALSLKARVFKLNAAVDGIGEFKSVRDYVKKSFEKENIVVIVDEIHHFNKSQQDVLLPSIERDEIVVIGITTENPFFYINKSLLSRFLIFEFKKHNEEDLSLIIKRAIEKGYDGKISITDKAREILIRYCDGDARRLLNALEASVVISKNNIVDENAVVEILSTRYVSYDKKYDEHYDVISAFIKSMRGTDPDATLYWLGKMIYAGEDPLFIARRIVICASEDVGLANPMALVVANSAFEAVKNIGMPEARIILAHAALYVCLSPKSNSAYLGIEKAIKEVKEGPHREVPPHLRNFKISDKNISKYKNPHDFPSHYIEQEYMPNPKKFYVPTEQGNEAKIKKFLEEIKRNEKKA